MIKTNPFEDLFVLELANNHWGSLERGLRIVHDFSRVVRHNGVRAAIKLQFRDVENFIHKDFRERSDIRYIKKTLDTRLSKEEFAILVEAIRKNNCVRMATPFDEASVDLCCELDIEIIKIASSDMNDWPLIEKIAKARKPVIFSTGGATLKDIDDMVTFFNNRNIPCAVNHCVSMYPTEEKDLQLNQIDFLRNRYPDKVIGFSSHEHLDVQASMLIAYAKGARTFERHIDLDWEDHPITPYCSTPEKVDEWFQAYRRAKAMCGLPSTAKYDPTDKETTYLDALVRGVYAKRDLKAGHVLSEEDYYLAIPLQKGQISCRELFHGEVIQRDCPADGALMIDMLDSPYSSSEHLRSKIESRGL